MQKYVILSGELPDTHFECVQCGVVEFVTAMRCVNVAGRSYETCGECVELVAA